MTQVSHQFQGLSVHGRCLIRGGVIKPEQVQNAVHQQQIEHGRERALVMLSQARCGGRGKDHIPQQFRCDFGELAFRLGEGEHIGGFIDPAVVAVEALHLLIINHRDTEFTVSAAQVA